MTKRRLSDNGRKIINSEYIDTKWSFNNREHYANLGYIFTSFGDCFSIPVDDLMPYSAVDVSVSCPQCGYTRKVQYGYITRRNHTYCRSCGKIDDLSGMRFGRLLVLDYVGRKDNNKSIWRCLCDCGNIKNVVASDMIKGSTTSCGCYRDELNWDKAQLISGSNHPQWNNGKTRKQRIAERKESTSRYRYWRKSVFERDNYTCQYCYDNAGHNLRAHHIINYSSFPPGRYDVDNGATMCKHCHKVFHGEYGYSDNNSDQLAEFYTIMNSIDSFCVLY